MLERYTLPEMQKIWSLENKYQAWLKVELLACAAWAELGIIPQADLAKLQAHAHFDVAEIAELESVLKHDVIAFTRSVSNSLGEERKWVHYGLTSTDVVDTAYGYLYRQANQLIRKELGILQTLFAKLANQYRYLPMMGRTHGVHAEITSFGLLFALWFKEIERQIVRYDLACQDIECGKISGAVGTYANIPPFIQDYVCEKLAINSSPISTQILQRDRHAFYFSVLAGIGDSLEKFATEIRHLQRTEVREVQEAFSKGQKGSSAMPHKKNPIACENICGCARVMRGYMLTANENVALWHQRDISHSAAERIIAEDATTLLYYMLKRFNRIINNLVVFEAQMAKNIELTKGVIFSQQILLTLIQAGMSREAAYDLIQPIAQKCWLEQSDFQTALEAEPQVLKYLDILQIKTAMDPKTHLKNVDIIMQRAGIDAYLANHSALEKVD